MNRLVIYVSFNGNCKEAMEFYQQCLGGELRFHTIGQSTKTDNLPKRMNSYILQASHKRDDLVLMGTDMNEEELLQGNSVSILLVCANETKIKAYYKNLEVGGKPTQPLQETHSGDLFGGLTDKYGNHWLFHYKR